MTARAVARRLVAAGRPGSIVTVTSMNGVAPGPNAGRLRRDQGGGRPPDPADGARVGPARDPGQRRRARADRRRDVRAHLRRPRHPPSPRRAGAAGPARDRRRTSPAVVLFLLSDQPPPTSTAPRCSSTAASPCRSSPRLPRPESVDAVGAGTTIRRRGAVRRNLLLSGGPGHDFDATSHVDRRLLRGSDGDRDHRRRPNPTAMLDRAPVGRGGGDEPFDLLTVHALHWRMDAERYAHLARRARVHARPPTDAAVDRALRRRGRRTARAPHRRHLLRRRTDLAASCAARRGTGTSSRTRRGPTPAVDGHRRGPAHPITERPRRLHRGRRGLRLPRRGPAIWCPC